MKRTSSLFILATAVGTIFAAAASGDIRLQIPAEVEPPLYTTTVAPYILPEGGVWAVNDGDWAVIAFARPIASIPADQDLVSPNFAAIGTPMLVSGFAIFGQPGDHVPIATQVQGLGAVPVWFMHWSELQGALADESLTLAELQAMPSLQRGTATRYEEQNHLATHQVSHMAAVARGTLENGRRFDLRVVEVQLAFPYVSIEFN